MKSAIILASVAGAFATVHQVQVGDRGLNYDPDTITGAAEGDVIEFVFGSGHDVVQGSFDNPCQPSGDSAVYSGFPDDGQIFSVTLNSTDPIWFYCSAPHHCQGGMAMVVNPPSSGDSLDAYKSASQSVGSANAPANVQGGVFGAPSDSSSSSSSSSSSDSSSPSSTASSSASDSTASSAETTSASSASSEASSSATSSPTSSSSESSTSSSSGSSASNTNAAGILVHDGSLMAGAILAGGLMLLA